MARADSYEDQLHIHGNNASTGQYSYFAFDNATGQVGYSIQSGDKLLWMQNQSPGARGGIVLLFSDGSNTAWNTLDQDGQYMNSDTFEGVRHARRVELSAHAGKTITRMQLVMDGPTAAGVWDAIFNDLVLVSADGTVRPVFVRQQTVSFAEVGGTSGVTERSYEVAHWAAAGHYPPATTTYYHGDHLGSARLTSGYDGYPTWRATYLPFGQEHNPQPTVTTRKFTGQERDAESGLDYFIARYYTSAQGRFLSPDPISVALERLVSPQALNLYTYAKNNPLFFVDPTGMEVAVTCEVETQCTTAVDALNNREGKGFDVTLGEDGVLKVVGEVDESSLSESEKALLKAITDDKNRVELNVVTTPGGSDDILFGRMDGFQGLINGKKVSRQTIDSRDLKLFGDASKVLTGHLLGHEIMEGYAAALGELTRTDPSAGSAHIAANKSFEGMTQGSNTKRTSNPDNSYKLEATFASIGKIAQIQVSSLRGAGRVTQVTVSSAEKKP